MRLPYLLVLLLLLAACATSPTGMRQLKLFPDSTMTEMGKTAFADIKKKTAASEDPSVNRYVRCVVDAIIPHVEKSYEWEVTVFNDDSANAFALPGGKIGVHTGLLEVAETQDQLAAVIGHEIAHVTADHGNARVSMSYATNFGLDLLGQLAGVEESATKKQLMGLLGLGVQVGVALPYGRGQESEADIVGLDYLARAGFDPRGSVELWKNMAAAGGEQPPEFLSTHPSHTTRISDLEARMEQALVIYKEARQAGNVPSCRS